MSTTEVSRKTFRCTPKQTTSVLCNSSHSMQINTTKYRIKTKTAKIRQQISTLTEYRHGKQWTEIQPPTLLMLFKKIRRVCWNSEYLHSTLAPNPSFQGENTNKIPNFQSFGSHNSTPALPCSISPSVIPAGVKHENFTHSKDKISCPACNDKNYCCH